MSKKFKKLLVGILMFTMFCAFVTGCGSATSDEQITTTTNAPKVTTNEPETTTPEETTTKDTTTEEPTTVSVDDYDFKGEKLVVEMDKKDFFNELVIENGTKIYLNDIYKDTSGGDDKDRGKVGQVISIAIWEKYNGQKIAEFEDKYWEPGTDVFKITFEQNAVIEYNEGHKWYFYYVGENNRGKAVFDIYEID